MARTKTRRTKTRRTGARKITRRQKSRVNKAAFRLKTRKTRIKKACKGKARTKAGRARKARSPKCVYHKSRLSRNRKALTKARKARKSPRRAATKRRSSVKRRSTSKRRNPVSSVRHLSDGGEVRLDGNIVRVFSSTGKLVFDKRYGSKSAAVSAMKKHKSSKAFRRAGDRTTWDSIAMDNPRRAARKGTRRNAPISAKDKAALRRILATHRAKSTKSTRARRRR